MTPRRYKWLTMVPLAVLALISAAVLLWLLTRGDYHLGSDYSSFTGNLVRGQQELVRLRGDAMGLADSEDFPLFRQRMLQHLTTYENRRDTFLHGLADSGMPDELYQQAVQLLDTTVPEIDELRTLLQTLQPDDLEGRRQARDRLLNLEGQTAFVYSNVHQAVHRAAAEQKQFMYQLIRAVVGLVVALLLFGVALVLALLAVLRQGSKLQKLTVTDNMTGLLNRRGFEDKAEDVLRLAERTRQPVSLALADIDRFKRINDEHGHPVGDRALQFFAETLGNAVRSTDIVARLGGEEFAILMPNTDQAGAMELAERFRSAVCANVLTLDSGQHVRMTVSIGVLTVHPATTESRPVSRLYTSVDKALYKAKNQGRNQVVSATD